MLAASDARRADAVVTVSVPCLGTLGAVPKLLITESQFVESGGSWLAAIWCQHMQSRAFLAAHTMHAYAVD